MTEYKKSNEIKKYLKSKKRNKKINKIIMIMIVLTIALFCFLLKLQSLILNLLRLLEHLKLVLII